METKKCQFWKGVAGLMFPDAPWDWNIYLHIAQIYDKCRSIFQSHGAYGGCMDQVLPLLSCFFVWVANGVIQPVMCLGIFKRFQVTAERKRLMGRWKWWNGYLVSRYLGVQDVTIHMLYIIDCGVDLLDVFFIVFVGWLVVSNFLFDILSVDMVHEFHVKKRVVGLIT